MRACTVRITKAFPTYWYADKIGETFDVVGDHNGYHVIDWTGALTNRVIRSEDCEEVGDVKDSIRIGPVDYTILQQNNPTGDDGVKLYGEIDPVTCEISVMESLPEQRKFITYWHEVLHGILNHATLYKHSNDETLISTLAYGITQVLRDNPEMRGFEVET